MDTPFYILPHFPSHVHSDTPLHPPPPPRAIDRSSDTLLPSSSPGHTFPWHSRPRWCHPWVMRHSVRTEECLCVTSCPSYGLPVAWSTRSNRTRERGAWSVCVYICPMEFRFPRAGNACIISGHWLAKEDTMEATISKIAHGQAHMGTQYAIMYNLPSVDDNSPARRIRTPPKIKPSFRSRFVWLLQVQPVGDAPSGCTKNSPKMFLVLSPFLQNQH